MGKAKLTGWLQIAAAILIAVLAVGLYRAKSDAARTEAHVRELQADVEQREAALRELRAEIAQRESPANVEALAEERLGVIIGAESAALPESALSDRLPAPRPVERRE